MKMKNCLFSLQTISNNDSEKINRLLNQGYELLHSRGDKLFLIDINEDDELTQPSAELMFRFNFKD